MRMNHASRSSAASEAASSRQSATVSNHSATVAQLSFGNTLQPRTAQQLMADVLTVNGVGIGWDVAWGPRYPVPSWQWASAVPDIELPGGGRVQARGEALAGERVFLRDGVIEGPAPTLPVDVIEV